MPRNTNASLQRYLKTNVHESTERTTQQHLSIDFQCNYFKIHCNLISRTYFGYFKSVTTGTWIIIHFVILVIFKILNFNFIVIDAHRDLRILCHRKPNINTKLMTQTRLITMFVEHCIFVCCLNQMWLSIDISGCSYRSVQHHTCFV